MQRETNVAIHLKSGGNPVDITAPYPSDRNPTPNTMASETPSGLKSSSSTSITLVGAGGCGINLVRAFQSDKRLDKVSLFDTSKTNLREGEQVRIIANGSGSGSNRAENATEITREIAKLSDDALGVNDVAIVVFSLSGGSGSVLGPLLLREYTRKGVRAIAVIVADTSHSVGAKNTLNTLKTLTQIAQNNEFYIPALLFTNDNTPKRGDVDTVAMNYLTTLIALLTAPTYEVDRNDRLNWINPMKVTGTAPGLKLIALGTPGLKIDTDIVLGTESSDMVDSLLILLENANADIQSELPVARLKKTGFFTGDHPQVIGRVSSDISAIENIIDRVEKTQNMEKAQTHKQVNRLQSDSSDDLIL